MGDRPVPRGALNKIDFSRHLLDVLALRLRSGIAVPFRSFVMDEHDVAAQFDSGRCNRDSEMYHCRRHIGCRSLPAWKSRHISDAHGRFAGVSM